VTTTTAVGPEPATYRLSAILAALRVMWRASGAALPFIAVNAVVQAGLMYLDTLSGFSAAFLAAFAASAASALVLYAVLAAAALAAVDGDAAAGSVLARARRSAAGFAGWTIVQWALILLVSLIDPALILLVAAATPFLPLAASDGRGNAMAWNFRAIGGRAGRWLVTTAILLVAGVVLYLLAAVNTFFIKGTPAAAIFWLVIGVVSWWLLTAWALIYRQAVPSAEVPAD
jgi:hypothetical protein